MQTSTSTHRWLTLRYVRFNWKILVTTILVLSLSTMFTLAFAVNTYASELVITEQQAFKAAQEHTRVVRSLQSKRLALDAEMTKIDQQLPGVVPSAANLFIEQFTYNLQIGDYTSAALTLDDAVRTVSEILRNQDEIAQAEVERLQSLIKANSAEMDKIFADKSVLSSEKLDLVNDPQQPPLVRLSTARDLVKASSDTIQARRLEMQDAVKQIVVRKKEMKLYMYENGQVVYSMPVSLGRPGAATKSGQFSVLDKLGTVWSFWQIWLPQWMGIYFAGSSENGIHGLPFDKQGRTYWKNEVGAKNITYGCVMPNDENMTKLYEWADVGIPVTIVE